MVLLAKFLTWDLILRDPQRRSFSVAGTIVIVILGGGLGWWSYKLNPISKSPPDIGVEKGAVDAADVPPITDDPAFFSVSFASHQTYLRNGSEVVLLGGGTGMSSFSSEGDPAFLSVRLQDGHLFMSCLLPGNTRVVDSKLQISDESWDRNLDSTEYEIVDAHKDPMLQVIYDTPHSVRIYGIFPLRRGFFYVTPKAAFDRSGSMLKGELTRLFEYPSRLHEGKEVN